MVLFNVAKALIACDKIYELENLPIVHGMLIEWHFPSSETYNHQARWRHAY